MYASHTLWDNFPHSILTPQAARWYVNSLLVTFNQADLSAGEQHALRVCCLLSIPPPPPGVGNVTLNVTSDLSPVSLNTIVRIVEDLALGMGWLGPHIEANHAIISRTLIPHLAKIMGHPSCITCLRLRQVCECWVAASYEQLRTSPPAFTMLMSMAPHQVTSQANGLHSMGMPSFGLPMATAWSSTGSTTTATGWTPPGQPVFPTPTSGIQGCFTGQLMGGAPSTSMGGMPPLRQTHPTTQSQQPHQQATPYIPAVDVPQRVSFTPETSTSTGNPSYYSDMVREPASGGRQPQGHSTERQSTTSSSGSSRQQDQYWRGCLKSQHRKGSERSLTISDTPVEVVPKDPMVYPSLGWT